jgi:hypothetical protein
MSTRRELGPGSSRLGGSAKPPEEQYRAAQKRHDQTDDPGDTRKQDERSPRSYASRHRTGVALDS